MQESIVFLVPLHCRRKESSRSLSHLLISFFVYFRAKNGEIWYILLFLQLGCLFYTQNNLYSGLLFVFCIIYRHYAAETGDGNKI